MLSWEVWMIGAQCRRAVRVRNTTWAPKCHQLLSNPFSSWFQHIITFYQSSMSTAELWNLPHGRTEGKNSDVSLCVCVCVYIFLFKISDSTHRRFLKQPEDRGESLWSQFKCKTTLPVLDVNMFSALHGGILIKNKISSSQLAQIEQIVQPGRIYRNNVVL